MDDSENAKVGSIFDSAGIILLVTALAYLAAFFFDVGYLSFFGLPMILAEVSLRGLLLCAGSGVWLGIVYILAEAIATVLPFNVAPIILRQVTVLCLISVAIGTYVWLDGAPWRILGALSVLPIAFVIFEMLVPLYVHRDKPTYAGRLSAEATSRKLKDKGIRARMLRANIDFKGTHVFIVLMFFLVICFTPELGFYVARTQTSFAIRLDPIPCLVLRVRQEGVLCTDADLQRHLLSGSFEFITPANVKLRMIETGRFKEFATKQFSASPPIPPIVTKPLLPNLATPDSAKPAKSPSTP